MTDKAPPIRSALTPEAWTHLITRRLERLRYGTIQLVVHEGRVVQVDCTERVRFSAASRTGGAETP